MIYSAVIFDLFGTLVDDFASSVGPMHAELAAALAVPYEAFMQLWRQTAEMRTIGAFQTVEASIEYVCGVMGVQVGAEQMTKAVAIRLQHTSRALEPRPDAVATLARLKDQDYKVGLLSNCSVEIPILWQETAFANLVATPVFSCRERLKKPDPRIYHLACERLGVMPEHCVYVADGENHELAAAASVGLHAVLIRNSTSQNRLELFRESREWQGATIQSLAEIVQLTSAVPWNRLDVVVSQSIKIDPEYPLVMNPTPSKEFDHPQGFLSLAKNVGIKDSTLDLTVIYSTKRARAAALFTRNRFPGAPVIVGRKHIAKGFAQALVINSKNANVAMGKQGIDNAIETCRIVGRELGINHRDVLPFSTGVIGRPLPMDKIRAGLRGIRGELKPDNLKLAAEAIMTTDKYPKYVSCRVGSAVIAGIAKGAGMIEPNMATMLVYLMTDAELPAAPLRPMLKRVVDRTFNCMSIDTDTSTSDTVILMANGLAGKVNLREFESGLLQVCEYLTREIARSGEGATKLITVDVTGAKSPAQAKRVGKCVGNSPLVKTAVYGSDPNWGRVIMAVGKSFDKSIEPAKVTIRFGDTDVFRKGSPVACDLEGLRQYLRQAEVAIGVDLGIGKAAARVWGCDLTEGYIKENAYYTT